MIPGVIPGMIPVAADVTAACGRIRDHILVTPLLESAWLSRHAGAPVSLKLESLQFTGSFKLRGALNALMRLPKGTHVVTASAGNHGSGIASAAKSLGLSATVFTPADAPETKLATIRRYGAALDTESADYDAAETRARQFASERRGTFISSYNHPDVITGGGTIGIEILDASPQVDTLVVPVGGGGLIAGIALAVRDRAPTVRIIGVEPEASGAMIASLRAGRIVTIEPGPTLADGLSGNLEPETMTFELVQRLVDDVVTVTEGELATAIRGLARYEHLVAEGSGAAATAAVIAGKIGRPRQAVVLLSGGNIDLARLTPLLLQGEP